MGEFLSFFERKAYLCVVIAETTLNSVRWNILPLVRRSCQSYILVVFQLLDKQIAMFVREEKEYP